MTEAGDPSGAVAPAVRLASAMKERVSRTDWAGAGAIEAELGAWLERFFQRCGGLDGPQSADVRARLRDVVEIYGECLESLRRSRDDLGAELGALPRTRRQLDAYVGTAGR
jgi:hypothetical protein